MSDNGSIPSWRDPKQNVMGSLLVDSIERIIKIVGSPSHSYGPKVPREQVGFSAADHVHVDLGGEGYHESHGVISGYNGSININAQTKDSQPPFGAIPHLVHVNDWNGAFVPLAEQFADYITSQGTPLFKNNVSEILRCTRKAGKIALWIDQDSFKDELELLATNLSSYIEYNPWDEFSGKAGYKKLLVSVPGPTYMFGYSQGNHWFFIQPVTAEGGLGEESDRGGWSYVYNTLTTFKIRSRTYVFGWSSEKHYYFIQELLPKGKLASETATGKFNFTYDTMKAMTIGGGTYLFGHSKAKQYLFAQELMDGGRLGEEVFIVTGADYDQMIPFVYGADTFMFTFHTNTKSWDIWSVDAHGVTVIDTGKWNNSYNHTIVSVKGRPYLFGIKQNGYWFLQGISPQGKMQEETGNGTWRNYYATLSYYCYGQRTYLFGQNSTGHRNWFLQEILEGGKMGKETDHGTFRYAYETADLYAQYE